MTFPLFDMTQSKKGMEMVVRAKRISLSLGCKLTEGESTTASIWEGGGLYVFYDHSRCTLRIYIEDWPQRSVYLKDEMAFTKPYIRDDLIDSTLEILRKHMVLDDLAKS